MKNSRAGFTLIEILIAVTILATISMLAARSIQQGIGAKVKIQSQIDDISRLRDALRLMERDINLAYHHMDFERDLNELLKKNGSLPKDDPPREAPRLDPATHFVGSSESVSFVTMNNARMVRNSRQADFVEVGYALKDCRSADGTRSSKCLWRRSSQSVDRDVTKGGDEVVLLEDVSVFELQYLGKGKQDWVKIWRTDQGGDAVTKNNFPQAVEITLGVSKGLDNAKKNYKLTIVASIHFPNNKENQGETSRSLGAPQ
ncbi:MAG: prepilin-type N-terminal cleavage/methylation domain-containing protein [Bdellovibrionaceae bacterium]|nr:prepilin-type N-terminal cleavage/methylation domain-containing protein [Pseudobdellovibrionaceae bacterium]